mgnify:CR=1 FL=1
MHSRCLRNAIPHRNSRLPGPGTASPGPAPPDKMSPALCRHAGSLCHTGPIPTPPHRPAAAALPASCIAHAPAVQRKARMLAPRLAANSDSGMPGKSNTWLAARDWDSCGCRGVAGGAGRNCGVGNCMYGHVCDPTGCPQPLHSGPTRAPNGQRLSPALPAPVPRTHPAASGAGSAQEGRQQGVVVLAADLVGRQHQQRARPVHQVHQRAPVQLRRRCEGRVEGRAKGGRWVRQVGGWVRNVGGMVRQ